MSVTVIKNFNNRINAATSGVAALTSIYYGYCDKAERPLTIFNFGRSPDRIGRSLEGVCYYDTLVFQFRNNNSRIPFGLHFKRKNGNSKDFEYHSHFKHFFDLFMGEVCFIEIDSCQSHAVVNKNEIVPITSYTVVPVFENSSDFLIWDSMCNTYFATYDQTLIRTSAILHRFDLDAFNKMIASV